MKKTFSGVTSHLSLRQSTVRHFCNLFGIRITDGFVGNLPYYYPSSQCTDGFIQYLKKHIKFLLNFQDDYYSDKSPKVISETIGRDLKEIKPYLMETFPHIIFINSI